MVTLAQARKGLADLVTRAAYTGEHIILSKHGKAACALVSMSDLKALEEMERLEDEADNTIADARQNEPTIPWEEVQAGAGLIASKKKARRRAPARRALKKAH